MELNYVAFKKKQKKINGVWVCGAREVVYQLFISYNDILPKQTF